MNWLAWDARPFLGAAVGALGGGWAYAALLPGSEAPWLVGLGQGAGAFLLARDRSLLRGWVLGALALWASALAQCLVLPGPEEPLVARLAGFHDSLTFERVTLHALGALLAGWIGARCARLGSPHRVAGS